MKITRTGRAVWRGDIKDGHGTISTASGAMTDYPYGLASRFEGQQGSNPEELLAAAHASCFTMALAMILGEARFTPESLETSAAVTIERLDAGYAITTVHLEVQGKVAGMEPAKFEALAANAKAGCPVSKVLKAQITLTARLVV
jgi:lipoyl-dependent peroxiredoxin